MTHKVDPTELWTSWYETFCADIGSMAAKRIAANPIAMYFGKLDIIMGTSQDTVSCTTRRWSYTSYSDF